MIIKIGSNQKEHVQEIQEALGIWVDGDFGTKTEKAVKQFQKENGLDVDGIVGPKTYEALMHENHMYTLDQIQEAVKSKGYKWFETGDYNFNLVGVRSPDKDGKITNKYDDYITLSYKINGEWKFHCWPATTQPGLYWINHPMNRRGCAILVPDQYRGVYKIDGHGKTRYKALCQRAGKVRVYRDGNKDDIYDYDNDTITEGYYGINIHRSSAYKVANNINKYSAGCQVFKDPDDFDDMMDLAYKAKDVHGNNFTYTLLNSTDINS